MVKSKLLKELFYHGIKYSRPKEILKKKVKLEDNILYIEKEKISLNFYKRIFVIGAGKVSSQMGKEIEEILGERIKGGIIITKYGHGIPLLRIRVREASHPLPDENGRRTAEEILNLAKGLEEKDILIVLLSGGGSALLPLPPEGISLVNKQEVTEKLMNQGANIEELNIVRKHISCIKGGWLAYYSSPARIITLSISDVIGNHPSLIASGPTVPDSSTFKDAYNVLKEKGIWENIPENVKNYVSEGIKGKVPETPKGKERFWDNTSYHILLTNKEVLEEIKKEASKRIPSYILTSTIHGEAKEIAKFYASLAREIRLYHRPFNPPVLLISGGETTVKVKGKGKGGRNQELALSFAIEAKNIPGIFFLSAGTDGGDGPTDAAGALVSGKTYSEAIKRKISPEKFLENNDSYNFFKKINSLFITGPTETNIMDINLLYIS